MTVYADTSFFVSLYVADRHSKIADQWISSGARVCFTPLHSAEWAHAIAQQVFRNDMSSQEAAAIETNLSADLAAGLWLLMDLPVSSFELCAELARRHGPSLGVRTLDSLHVACALELKTERFWTFDERQANLARALGLKTN